MEEGVEAAHGAFKIAPHLLIVWCDRLMAQGSLI